MKKILVTIAVFVSVLLGANRTVMAEDKMNCYINEQGKTVCCSVNEKGEVVCEEETGIMPLGMACPDPEDVGCGVK